MLQAYRENANSIMDALENIKGVYLGKKSESET